MTKQRPRREKKPRPPKAAHVRAALERARKRKKERGIALIMVLGAITILTVFLTELQTDTTSAVAGALADRDRLKAEYYAKSAVNLSRMLIAAERPLRVKAGAGIIGIMLQQLLGTRRAPQVPIWEFSDMMLGAFNGGDRATVFGSNVGVDLSTAKNIGIPGGGYFEVTIVDEDSKININTAGAAGGITPKPLILQLMTWLARPENQAMFEMPDADGQQSDQFALCASLLDWADPDDILTNCADPASSAGSEDNIYQVLGLGYVRKNAPFDSLEEVRLVRGMDDDRWASFIDPEPNNPKKRLITVWGQDIGANVNTAPAGVVWMLACSVAQPLTPACTDPLQVQAFLQAFGLMRTLLRGAPIFTSAAGFKNALSGKNPMIGSIFTMMGVAPITFDNAMTRGRAGRRLFRTESKVFSIYAEGVVPGLQREARVRIHTVVDMRQATQWNQSQPTPDPTALAGADPASQAAADAADEAAHDQDFAKDLLTNPFGSVVYYRVD